MDMEYWNMLMEDSTVENGKKVSCMEMVKWYMMSQRNILDSLFKEWEMGKEPITLEMEDHGKGNGVKIIKMEKGDIRI